MWIVFLYVLAHSSHLDSSTEPVLTLPWDHDVQRYAIHPKTEALKAMQEYNVIQNAIEAKAVYNPARTQSLMDQGFLPSKTQKLTVTNEDGLYKQVFFYETPENTIKIAIAGSESPTNLGGMVDWLYDLDIKWEEYWGLTVHKGFALVADEVWDALITHPAWPSEKLPLELTGHSLGAATACILAWRAHYEGYPIQQIVDFGQPRFLHGKDDAKKFADLFPILRIVNKGDPIPRLVQRSINYYHSGPYVWYNNKDKIDCCTSPADMTKANDHHQVEYFMSTMDYAQDYLILDDYNHIMNIWDTMMAVTILAKTEGESPPPKDQKVDFWRTLPGYAVGGSVGFLIGFSCVALSPIWRRSQKPSFEDTLLDNLGVSRRV